MRRFLRNHRTLLGTLALVLAAAFFLKFRTTLIDRIAYNNGYDAGELERTIDREILKFESFHRNIFTSPKTRKMYNTGFEDGFQGRERRYTDPASKHDVPTSGTHQFELPDSSAHSGPNPNSQTDNYVVARLYGIERPETDEAQEDERRNGYPVYGEAPPKPAPTRETSE